MQRQGDAVVNALSGRVAIITGGSEGLGLAISRAYLQAGACALICSRENAKVNSAVATLLGEGHSGEKLLGLAGDVSEPEDAKRVVDRTLSAWGKIEILVNNAGVYGPKGPIDDVDWDLWVKAVGINLVGSVL